MPSFLSHAGARYPTTNAVEINNFYELQTKVPGFDKKDVQVEVPDNHTIVLKGSTEQKQEATEGITQRVVATAIDKEKQVA